MKIRSALAAIAVTTALALAGCSAPAPAPSGTNGGDAETASVTLALATQAGCPFCIAVQRGAEAAAADRGIDLNVVVPRTAEASAQVQQLTGVLASAPDALLLLPYDATALVATVKEFAAQDIPTVTIDTDIADPSVRAGVIASDNTVGGELAADELAELVGETGKVLYVGYQPGASSTDARMAGFESQIAEYPGIDYLGPQLSNADPAQAASKVSAALKANPDVAGIFVSDEGSAIGTANALKEAGLDGTVKVVAFDGAPVLVEGLEQGTFDVLIVQQAYQMGYDAMQQVADLLQDGTPIQEETITDFVVVNRDNIDDPEVVKFLYPAE